MVSPRISRTVRALQRFPSSALPQTSGGMVVRDRLTMLGWLGKYSVHRFLRGVFWSARCPKVCLDPAGNDGGGC